MAETGKVIFLILLLLLPCSGGMAAEEAAGSSPGMAGMPKDADGPAKEEAAPAKEAAAPAKEDERLPIYRQDQWQFFLTPYLWIPGVNATTSSLKNTQGINVPWWEVVPTLFSNTFGAMGRAEAWKGRWGFFVDGFFVYAGFSGSAVGASREKTFGPVDFSIDKQIQIDGVTMNLNTPGQIRGNVTLVPSGSAKSISRLVNLDWGGRFLVGAWPLSGDEPLPTLSMEILGGPRFNSINQYTRINLSGILIGNAAVDLSRFSLVAKHETIKNGSLVIDYTNQYVEPFLGLRFGLWLTQDWLIDLTGDVGGFGLLADDHVDCNLELLLGYRVNKSIYAWAGYRAYGSWYNLGESLAQINFSGWFHGPVLGMTYAF